MISYKKLFALLEEKEISKTELQSRTGISSATLAKLSKNEEVSMRTIQSICECLNCQPGEMMSMEKKIDKNSLLYKLREEKDMKLKGGLYHQTQIKMAYNSNHMEGSRLTEDQTRCIYETDTIGTEGTHEKIDDIIEAVNHFRCFDYMLDIADNELTEDIIKKLHLILKTGTTDSRVEWFAVGDYKRRPNLVGNDVETTHPSKVPADMKALIKEYRGFSKNTFEDIVAFHYKFEKIHPFQDGNGRVGRLIMFKECLKNDITPFIIEDVDKEFYRRGLREFLNEKGYLIETCRASQDKYKKWLQYFEYI